MAPGSRLPLTACRFFCLRGYAAQSRKARCKKTAGAPSEAVPLSSRRRTGGEWLEPVTLPTTSRLCRAIAQSAMQKTAGALSEAVPLSSRRRTGGEWLEPATLPHHEQAMPRNRAAMHKQLSSPKRSPPPHTPLKHPAMSLLCIHIPQNSCTIFVILLCRG